MRYNALNTSNVEKAALIRCRTASRFRFDKSRPAKATREEAAEEQTALYVEVPAAVYQRLKEQGLVEWRNGWCLTDKGLAAIAAIKPGVKR